MESISYVDFDLLIEHSQDGYVARVINSPAGQASSPFKIPFSDLEIENTLLRVGQTRRGVRRLESAEMGVARVFGQRLFESVFNGSVRERFRTSLNEVNRQGTGLRLRLRMSDVPELADLPWEFMYDPNLDRFMVLSVATPLVRYLELPQEVTPQVVKAPLNILVMISSPADYPPLNVNREWEKLNDALKDLEQRRLVALTQLELATLADLQRLLRRGEFHIFHFIGHGKFDRQEQDGVLLMEDESGRGRPVSGRFLGTLLHDHRPLRLAILNSCEGARTSRSDPFAGSAQSLVQQGIPAVIAMQFEITDEASIVLAHEFYGALADGYPVDAALSEARKAIFAEGNDIEWGTPVLYMRAPDGLIFDVSQERRVSARPTYAARAIDKETQAHLEQLYTDGLSAFWLEDWGRAIQNFEAVLEIAPDYQEASGRLETARRQQQLSGLYSQALEQEKEEKWGEASETLEAIASLSRGYKDVAARLESVKKQNRLASLYAEARQLHRAQKWEAVVNVFSQITTIQADYPDREGLLASANLAMAEADRQRELDGLYRQAVQQIDASELQAAYDSLMKVTQLKPGYRDADRLLQRVISELEAKRTEQEVEAAVPVTALQPQVVPQEVGERVPGIIRNIDRKFLALTALTAAIGYILSTNVITWLYNALGEDDTSLLVGLVVGGAIVGGSLAIPSLNSNKILLTAGKGALGLGIGFYVFKNMGYPDHPGQDLLFGSTFGLAIVMDDLISKKNRSISRWLFFGILGGVAGLIGFSLKNSISETDLWWLSEEIGSAVAGVMLGLAWGYRSWKIDHG